jgi:glycosyltransferase involved in cell wall biosynthesis
MFRRRCGEGRGCCVVVLVERIMIRNAGRLAGGACCHEAAMRLSNIVVSIVIPTLNEEHHLGSLLSDISHQTRRADEVIVVDAGSEDGTVSVAKRFPNVVFLTGSPPVAAGRNLSGHSAHGDVLIFLDADVRLRRRFFERFLGEFEERRLDVACPSYVPHRSTLAIRSVFAFFNLLFRAFEKVMPSGAGHCIV